MAKQPKKLIANNKKVYHDYFLEETFEAGIALAGTEVKSMRMGKCNSKIKLFIAVICMFALVMSVSGCGNGNSGSDNANATQDTVATYKVNRGEFNWSGNEYTSLLPNQKEWNVSQYLVDDSRKCCSVIIDNSDLKSTKQYVKSLEKTGVSTVKSQVTDDKKNPIFNYLGESDSYDISISYTGGITTISITKTK